jgi:hypothetical protein
MFSTQSAKDSLKETELMENQGSDIDRLRTFK